MASWRRLVLEVPEADTELCVALLHECGTLGLSSEPGRLIAWFAAAVAPDDPLGRALAAIPSLRVVSDEQVADGRWHERWMERLEAFPIGSRFVVVPEGRPLPPGGRTALRVTPGRAFGTGEHPTTRLCLEMLEEQLRADDAVLDAGTGSGILAIAARLMGARRVAAIDLDPVALEVAARNAAASGAAGIQFAVTPLEAIRTAGFDLVVANIDAATLTRAMPRLASMAGRVLIVSGLLTGDERDVAAALRAAGLSRTARREEEGWLALALAPRR